MKNGKIGYAVVGLGIGKAHVDAAAASDKCELVAVCDLIQEKMDKVAERYPGTLTYLEFDEMIKNPDIDIVSICLPSAMHAEFAVKAMEAGKNVLVEKPIDITVDAALKIEEARVRTSMKAGVIHQNRNNAVMKPIKEAVDAGRLGKLVLGTFAVKWYRDQHYYEGWHGTWGMDGGGSLMNQAVHTVDLMQWLMGDVVSVHSTMGIYNHDIETEDMTASVITFKSGAAATFVSTTCAYPGISTDIQLYGTGGTIEADADVLKRWKLRDADDEDEEEEDMLEKYGGGNRIAEKKDPMLVTGHASMVEDMLDAVINDRDPQILPLEAIKSVRIVNAVYESARTGKTIYFD
ncbi:MAG: Gfo/Idh/MocA family oxidoreductase [Clostridiales bacterium]|nr:Gfo/Idh/MocA family oxidoreductase [Clostridiales bacterium]